VIKPKVILADRFYMCEEASRLLRENAEVLQLDASTEADLIPVVGDAVVICSEYAKVTKNVMDAAPLLKGVVVYGVGFDHVDVKAASERGIYVANCRGSNAEAVAELVYSLILSLARKPERAFRYVKEGKWTSVDSGTLPGWVLGIELYGKTMGILGLGEIGRRVARIAKGFDMKVLGYDPYLSPDSISERGAIPTSLDEIFRESDFLTVHVPLSPDTRYLINLERLSSMKKTAILVNCSRGAVVKEADLIEALERGLIAGAGLDVFEREPISPDSPLIAMENVILTPHIGASTREAIDATSMTLVEETVRILRGAVPRNLVNTHLLRG